MSGRQRDTVPHGGTQLQYPGKPVSWLQGGTPKLSVNRNRERLKDRGLMGRNSLPYSCNREIEGQELLLGLAKDKRLWEGSGWHSSSPAAAPAATAALAPGIWCSRHHEEQHNWNDVHPLQVRQVDKETGREEGR